VATEGGDGEDPNISPMSTISHECDDLATSARLGELPDRTDLRSGVRRSSVILVVASEFGIEGFLLLSHLLVAVLLAPLGECGQAPTKPLAHRPHLDGALPSSAACADVRQAEEVEGAGLLRLPLRASFRPNSTSRVFSECNVRPYLENRFGKTFVTFSASSLYWKHRMASSAKRIS
jgi:hypothetical protein